MENSFLSQEEIDALLKQSDEKTEENGEITDLQTDEQYQLTPEEQDALGEIGNISMGSASTALSDFLGKKVLINTPKVSITTIKKLYESFQVPYIMIEVNYTSGIEGTNLLIIKVSDAILIADLMMGETGENPSEELDEIKISAVAEAMNQMIGSAATSLSTIFGKKIEISPPTVTAVDINKEDLYSVWNENEEVAVVSFDLQIDQLLDSEIMQIIPIDVAKKEVEYLMADPSELVGGSGKKAKESEKKEKDPIKDVKEEYPETKFSDAVSNKNLNLILDVPLKVSVLLGKTRKPIEGILRMGPGSIVELEKMADEPVDILVNGTLIAKGEVVVVGENFGVKITDIISPEKRLKNLGKTE